PHHARLARRGPRDLRPPPSFPTRRSSDLCLHGNQPRGGVDFRVNPDDTPRKRHFTGGRAYTHQLADLELFKTLFGNCEVDPHIVDRKSTRLNSSHVKISYAVFCLKKKKRH